MIKRLTTRPLVTTAIILSLFSCKSEVGNKETKANQSVELSRETVHDLSHVVVDFLESLNAELKDKASFEFEDEERYNWHFVPKNDRKGVAVEDLDQSQREKLMNILSTALSDEGYRKANDIMQLEVVLQIIEGYEPGNRRRNPELYYLSVFGDPSGNKPWGWRYEGHHLSLNFTSMTGELTAVSPSFMGTNPAIVRETEYKGKEVLKQEQDLGRALVKSFSEDQLVRALIMEKAPGDILTFANREINVKEFEGIPYSVLNPDQQSKLIELLEVYLGNMNQEIATQNRQRIDKAGLENIYFAWAGGLEPGEGHYYRIHGPVFLIEYDNVQNNNNHIHTVWRDLENDFGKDLLKKHYQESDHH
ncbi:MAG: DUF3500 domain-containing protein [Bacteroidetes bacterium]|nr:DUF3500 domain-containing protein [Bacteroidota bacterium]